MEQKNKILQEEYIKKLEGYASAAKNAGSITYTSLSGVKHEEKSGRYNYSMVKSMVSDMFTLYAYTSGNNPKTAKILLRLCLNMTEFNSGIMQMFDDYANNRPIKSVFQDNICEEFSKDMIKIAKSNIIKDYKVDNIDGRIKMWIERMLYQLTWAYTLEQKEFIRNQIICAKNSVHDPDDRQEMSAEDKKTVINLCKMRNILLDLYLKIPVLTPEHTDILNDLEVLHAFVEAIVENKSDQLMTFMQNV